MLRLFNLLLLLSLCNICFAKSESLTQDQIASIKSLLPEVNLVEYGVFGVLSDGEMHVAVSYVTKGDRKRNEKERADSQERISRCAIFKLQPLTLIAKSKPITEYGPRDSVGCKIANGLLVIEHINTPSLVSVWTDTWKFKLINGHLALIGYDAALSEFGDVDQDRPYIETQKSLNFLNNQARLWRKTGKEGNDGGQGIKPFVVKKAMKIKEIVVPFVSPEWDFTSFDIDSFQGWINKNDDLCGQVNDRYMYQSCRKRNGSSQETPPK